MVSVRTRSVPPRRALPRSSGAPLAGVFTIASGALATSSTKPRSSVKRTRARSDLCTSSAVTVY